MVPPPGGWINTLTLQIDQINFVALVEEYHAQMVRLAQRYVDDPEIAQEVVQETWLAVLLGVPSFAARASLKTWIFAILLNQARTRGKQEKRQFLRTVSEEELTADDEALQQKKWPRAEINSPEAQLLWEETYTYLMQAIAALPTQQRLVITLYALEGKSAAEICRQLNVSEANQRVLLYRARQQVRHALQAYWEGHK
jgi:RNA polymerase sigma-70 factor (ECF subfamily)